MTTDHTLEFNRVYICVSCLEEVSLAEVESGTTPCCDAKYTDDALRLKADAINHYQHFTIDLQDSGTEWKKASSHIRSLPSDSKKRRKLYTKPKDTWPGKVGASYKKSRKPRKGSRGGNQKTQSLDIKLNSNSDSWTVNITGQVSHTIYGSNRGEARRKARAFLRSQQMSITTASSIEEGPNTTTIHFGD